MKTEDTKHESTEIREITPDEMTLVAGGNAFGLPLWPVYTASGSNSGVASGGYTASGGTLFH